MKLQLINSPILPTKKEEGGETLVHWPPLGIMYIASYLRERVPDIQVKIADGPLIGYYGVLKEVETFKPDIIGISCSTTNSTGAYQLTNQLKSMMPHSFVILGGAHPTAMPEDAATRSNADLIVVGEGEVVFSEVVKKHLKEGSIERSKYRDIKGLVYIEDNRIIRTGLMPLISDIDCIPFPARDSVNLKDYGGWYVTLEKPETSILSSRGCPFYCHFCANPVWKLQKPWLRARSPKNIMDEVEELSTKYGVREYFDQCDELNFSLEWAINVCEEKVKRGIDIPWKVCLRADKISEEFVRALHRSNCWLVNLGIESGNQDTLNGIGKRITIEQVVRCCKLLKKYGIQVWGLFMLFNAWQDNGKLRYEDVEKSRNTLRFAKKLLKERLIDQASFAQATPYPGSKLWDTALRYNLIREKYWQKWEYWNNVWSFIMQLPNINEKDMMRLKNEGVWIQAWHVLRSGKIHLNDIPFLINRSWGLIKSEVKCRMPLMVRN